MFAFVKWLYLVALIVWVGEVVFFSFVGAPSLFRTFTAPEAGRAVGAIFPIYYRVGYACGVVVLFASVVFLGAGAARLWWGVHTVLVAIMLAATLYAGLAVLPRATVLRPQIHEATAAAEAKAEFDHLHALAVRLNALVLFCGIGATIITAARLRP
ncbi:MAG: hypothetical protein H6Q33_3328 [Deltaproteobacteria bacterium]|nr:hypothetical protein [Deltaproteobacteria bacterium]